MEDRRVGFVYIGSVLRGDVMLCNVWRYVKYREVFFVVGFLVVWG